MDELHGEAAGEEWILAIGLLAAAPAGIAKEVDVRRPERQPLITLVTIAAEILVVLGPRLIGDDRRHLEHRAIIPRRRDGNRLRKDRCQPRSCNAVQRLVPPVVLGHT